MRCKMFKPSFLFNTLPALYSIELKYASTYATLLMLELQLISVAYNFTYNNCNFFLIYFIFFYKRSICIIDNGTSRRRTRIFIYKRSICITDNGASRRQSNTRLLLIARLKKISRPL